tara:strand:+ start:10620 stop:10901 length:282 start_codon:yes stop_codon:yes gene_type:complete
MQTVKLSKVTVFKSIDKNGHKLNNWFVDVDGEKIHSTLMNEFFIMLTKAGVELIDDLDVFCYMTVINFAEGDFEKLIISRLETFEIENKLYTK